MIRIGTFMEKKNLHILKNTKLSFKKGSLFLLLIFFSNILIVNAQLLQWNTFGNLGTETTEPSVFNDPNIIATNLTQGTINVVGNGNRFGGNEWFDTGDTNPTTLTESITGNDYIQFVVTPNAGYSFTPTSFVFSWDRSGNGPSSVTLRSSVDGFTTDLGTVTGLGAAISTGNTITISGLTSLITATTFRLYGYGATATGGTGGFDVATDVVNVQLNGTTSSIATVDWCNLQWPASGSIQEGGTFNVYAQVYESGVTEVAGQGTGILGWIGYSTSNTDPSGLGWTWVAASFNTQQGNNDEFVGVLGSGLTPGTYYYASLFQINGGTYNYGGYSGGFWNGTTNVNGVLTITSNKVDWCNLQSPPSGSIQEGGTFNVYARVNEPGVTNAAGQGAGITAWIGVSPIGSNTNPNTWTTWIPALFNVDAGNDDEYMTNIATGLVPGTYYYASRFQKTGSTEYSYGGTGGFWNNDSGVLTVTSNKVDWCNLQYPDWGSIEQGGDYGVYAQVYEPGVTDAAGQGSDISAWIGYSTTDTNPSTWTNWIVANYNPTCLDCNGIQNDEYLANIGPGLSPGTYYYASRFQKTGSTEYSYGGYSASGGNIWDGTAYVSGVLIVNELTCNELIISEYGEGSSNNKYLEIYNPTANSIDLDGYSVLIYANGSGTATSTIILTGTISSLGTFVIKNSSAVAGISAQQTSGSLTFNGNDAVALRKGSVNIDIIGQIGVDPGTEWGSGITSTADNTLIRKATVQKGDSNGSDAFDPSTEWDGYAVDTWTYIGNHSSNCDNLPKTTVTPLVLSGFTYVFGLGPSASQTFTVSGLKLTANVEIAAPTDYEISLNSGGPYSASLSLAPTSGTLAVTTVYVRLKAGLAVGLYNNENISISSTGATIKYVTCSGEVTISAPEINVTGNGNIIANGDLSPQGTDHTSFGTAIVGSTTIDRVFTIHNLGSINLDLTGTPYVVISGLNAADFTVTLQPTANTIVAGSSLTFTVRFNPSFQGVHTALVSIDNNDSKKDPYTFAIQGTGDVVFAVEMRVTGNGNTIPDNDIYPSGTDHTAFGTALIGGGFIERTFTIVNDGTSNLNLTGTPIVRITGINAVYFSVVTQPSANTVPSNGSLTFVVRFTPTVLGTKTAIIEINNNDPDNNPYNFYISGTGLGTENIYVYGQNGANIPENSPASTATSTHFGGVNFNSGIAQLVFTIYNYSGVSITISNLNISGANASLFTITSLPTSNLLFNGNSTQFSIAFDPDSLGEKTTTVTFQTSLTDPDDVVFKFNVGGTGINYALCTLSLPEIIVQQDFEDTPATPVWNYTYTTEGEVLIEGGKYNNGSGPENAFIDNKSFQCSGIGTVTGSYESTLISFDPINTSEFENVTLSLRVGAFRTTDTQGLDVNDIVYIKTSIDGGINWSTEAILGGFSNSRWDFDTTGVFNVFYSGVDSGPKVDTRNGDAELLGSSGISTIYVNNLPKVNSLLVKVGIDIDREEEVFALDNIKITGQRPNIARWISTGIWQGGIQPAQGIKAIFEHDYNTSNGNITACACQVQSGMEITINDDDYFNIVSDIQNDGKIIIKNQGSLLQQNDNANNSGNGVYLVEKTTGTYYNYDYIYWSSPVVNTTIGTMFPLTEFPDRRYKLDATNYLDVMKGKGYPQTTSGSDGYDDDGDDWVKLIDTDVMQPGVGYIAMGKDSPLPFNPSNISGSQPGYSVQFNGKVNNGIIQPEVHKDLFTGIDSNNTNINLIGNPYPSAIDIIQLHTENNTVLSGVFYIWTHDIRIAAIGGPMTYDFSNSSYATGNVSGGVLTTVKSSSLIDFPRYIASSQGFIANALDGITNPSQITFKNSMRVTTPNTSFLRQAQEPNGDFSRIWLNMTGSNGLFRQLAVGFNPLLHDQFAEGEDAPLIDSANDTNFYSLIPNNNGHYAIQFLGEFEENKTIPLGVEILNKGTYQISIERFEGVFSKGQLIFLEDKYMGIIHNLNLNPYMFETKEGQNINDRFVLRFTDTALGIDENTLEKLMIYPNPSKGIFNLSYQGTEPLEIVVYDLLGKKLMNQKPTQKGVNTYLIDLSGYKTGIYLAKITVEGKQITKKLVVE